MAGSSIHRIILPQIIVSYVLPVSIQLYFQGKIDARDTRQVTT